MAGFRTAVLVLLGIAVLQFLVVMRSFNTLSTMNDTDPLVVDVSAKVPWSAKQSTSTTRSEWTSFPRAVAKFQCVDQNRAPCWTKSDQFLSWLWERKHSCSRKRPRCKKHLFEGKVNGPWIPCCEKHNLFELLVWFHNVVRDHIDSRGHGFWYSIAFGTLLASVRDGDLIDWDTDIDVVVPSEKLPWLQQLLQSAADLEDPPYSLSQNEYRGVTVLRLLLSDTNQAHMDIWAADGFDPRDPRPCVRMGRELYPAFSAFPLQPCRLQKVVFPCFAESLMHLELQYGRDSWKRKGRNKNSSEARIFPAACKVQVEEWHKLPKQ